MRYITLIAAVCLLLGGCQGNSPETITHTKPLTIIESSHINPETGNLIAWWMTRQTGTPEGELVPVPVTTSYAIFIQWVNEEYYPDSAKKRIFVFYDNVAKKSYQTRDFDAFLEVIAKQPQGITISKFDCCTLSRDFLPKENREKLEKVFAAGNRKWAVNPDGSKKIFIVCYCEFGWDFIFPGDKN